MPQLRGLGKASVLQRGETWIASGQEYRSATYGHLNLFCAMIWCSTARR